MINFGQKMKGSQKNGGYLLLAGFMFIAVMAVILNQGYNRFLYANNALTEQDLGICLDEIESQNYAECLEYLHETGQKDTSALWEGIPDYVVGGR